MLLPSAKSMPDLIGNTPLLHLKQVSELTGCTILGKAEFLNPGGSVKDRTALGIIRDAEKKGTLKPGGTIVEGTAGNTGIGLTLIANALGYRSVVVMPHSQSREKIELLDLYGADLRLVTATSYSDPNHYIHTARRLAESLNETEPNGAIWACQFDNVANCDIHETTTGQEIWEQTGGVARGLLVGLIVTLLSLFFTSLHIQHIGVTIAIVLMTSIMFSLAGFINAVFANNFDDVSIVPVFVLTPLTYLGGVFYSIDLLPDFWAGVSRLNPMLYIVNAFRYGVLGVSDVNVTTAFLMVGGFTIAAYAYCMYLLSSGTRLRQ